MWVRRIALGILGVVALGNGVPGAEAGPVGITDSRSNEAEAAHRRGMESLQKGDITGAEVAFKEAARLEPRAIQPLLGLAEVTVRQGQMKQAEAYLQQAVTLAPQQVDVHVARGRFFAQQQRVSEAEAAFTQAITLAPQRVHLHILFGTSISRRRARCPKPSTPIGPP